MAEPLDQPTSEVPAAKPASPVPKTAGSVPMMRVKIYAPFKTYYDDVASSISAENETGPFDILPHHKNFMTLLSPGDIIVRVDGKEDFKVNITRAVLHVKADEAKVFLDV